MIKKKVCLIGAYAVGKTSLIRRFVSGIFSDDYLSTVGVKIDQRALSSGGRDVLMMVWDLAGRDEFQAVQKTYLRGAAGLVYVVDGTRKESLEAVREEITEVEDQYPGVPSMLLVNKYDLMDDWELNDADFEEFRERGWPVLYTSAKTGERVSDAFSDLAAEMLKVHGTA
jgi:small GTP-binding protein